MAKPKKGDEIVSGQVPVEVKRYLRAFAEAKGSTLSKQLRAILEDWHYRRGVFSEVDKAAHQVAEDSTSYDASEHARKQKAG